MMILEDAVTAAGILACYFASQLEWQHTAPVVACATVFLFLVHRWKIVLDFQSWKLVCWCVHFVCASSLFMMFVVPQSHKPRILILSSDMAYVLILLVFSRVCPPFFLKKEADVLGTALFFLMIFCMPASSSGGGGACTLSVASRWFNFVILACAHVFQPITTIGWDNTLVRGCFLLCGIFLFPSGVDMHRHQPVFLRVLVSVWAAFGCSRWYQSCLACFRLESGAAADAEDARLSLALAGVLLGLYSSSCVGMTTGIASTVVFVGGCCIIHDMAVQVKAMNQQTKFFKRL